MRSQMNRVGMLAAGCGALAATAALAAPAAIAQTSFVTNIVYASHDTADPVQAKLACDAATSTTPCHIYVMNTDGAGAPVTSGPANDIDPAFSPDGTKIAFARDVGGQYDIFVMDANGTNVRAVRSAPKDDRYPAWSPDGSKIAFRGYPAVGGAVIYTMNPDGTGLVNIKNTGGGDQPTWSPDGTHVAYSGSYSTPTGLADDIFTQPVNAGDLTDPVNVTNDPVMSDRYPTWQPTPGSSQILFRKVNTNGRELWRVDSSTGASANLAVAATANIGRAASWSPDGLSAAFVSYAPPRNDQEIWLGAVNVAGNAITGARQLTNNDQTDDEPKLANVPVAASAVPPATGPAPSGGGGGTTSPVGVVSGGGTTITVGGGTLPDGSKALSLTLTVPKQILGRRKSLRAFVQCNARCSVNLTGSTKLKVRGKTRTLRLSRTKKTANANARTRVQLKIPAATLRAVRSSLRRNKRVKFSISATARTTAGQFTPAAVRPLTLRL